MLEDKKIEYDYMKTLITKEFLQLYFMNLGANPSLNVDTISDLYDLNYKKNKEKFCFAIVKTKLGEDQKSQSELDKRQNLELGLDNIKFIYPDEDRKLHFSLKFLFLAYSGFLNYDKRSLFDDLPSNSNDKLNYKRSTYFENLLNKVSESSDKTTSDELYKQIITNKELYQMHNTFIQSMCDNRIEKLYNQSTEPKEISGYSLFFIKEGNLIEIDSLHQKELRIVEKGVSDINVKEKLLEHIISSNENKSMNYLNDVVVFSEINNFDEDNEDRPTSEGLLVILITSIIFIIIFFIINPERIFYQMKSSFKDFFEMDGNVNKIEYQVNNVGDLQNYFYDIVGKLYDPDISEFPFSSSDSSSGSGGINTNTTVDSDDLNGNKYYPLNTNFYCGMLVNFKKTSFIETTDSNNNTINIRNSKLSYYGADAVEVSEPYLSFDNNNNNKLMPNSYSIFLKPNLNSNQEQWYLDQIEPVFDDSLYEFMFSILLYNMDRNSAFIYSIKFTFNSFGEVTHERFNQGFLPYLNDIPNQIAFLILSILYFIGFLYILFLVLRTTIHLKITEFPFEWYYWLDIIVLAVSFSSQVISYKSFLFLNKDFSIAIDYEDDFIFWLNQAITMKTYQRLTGIAILFICFRLVRFLYTSFPNFGIVFQTLGYAYKEILAFMTIVFSILIGIAMMTHIAFGYYSIAFKDVNSSIIETFLMFMGIFDYDNFYNDNYYNPIAPYFFVFFMVFMNLILINTFLCIIRNNYADVKEKKEKFNEAYALFLRDKTNEFKDKLENLILCKNAQQIFEEDQQKEKQEYELKDYNSDKEDIDNPVQVKNQNSGEGMFNNFLLNFKNLNIKEFLFEDNNNNAAFEKEKFKKYKEIDKKNMINFIEETDQDYEEECMELFDTICYIGFIIIFICMLFLQLSINNRSELEDYNYNYWESYFESDNISNFINVKDSLRIFIEDNYGKNSDTAKDCTITNHFSQDILENYIYITPPFFRMNFRFYKYVNNDDKNENEFFPYKLEDYSPLDSSHCKTVSELTSSFNIEISDKSYFRYPYTNPGDGSTPYECGGYVYYLNKTSPYCNTIFNKNYTNLESIFFAEDLPMGSLFLDSVIASDYYPFLIYSELSFIKNQMGAVNTEIFTYSIPIHKYQTSEDFTRLSVEIIYIVYVIYFIYLKFGSIIKILSVYLKNDYYRDRNHELFRNSSYINKYLRINFKEFENESLLKTLLVIFLKIIEKLIKLTILIISSVLKYIISDFFNAVDLASIIISIWQIIEWFSIVDSISSINFEYLDDDAGISYNTTENDISKCAVISQRLGTYTLWASINAFLILLRMIQYYKFSKPINMLINIIGKSKLTILFHLVFVAVVDIGFCFYAYALFSHNMESYSTVGNSVLQLIVILAGKVTYSSFTEADDSWAGVFIIFFTLINTLILFNVLNAIIIISYRELKHSFQASYKSGDNFFTNLKKIIGEAFIIYVKTANHCYENLISINDEIKVECEGTYFDSINELNEDYKSGKINISFYQKFLSKLSLTEKYISDVTKRIRNMYNLTLDKVIYSKYKNTLIKIPKEKLKSSRYEYKGIPSNTKEEKEDLIKDLTTEDRITSQNKISILHKMFMYIWKQISNKMSPEEINLYNLTIKSLFIEEKSEDFKHEENLDKVIDENNENENNNNEEVDDEDSDDVDNTKNVWLETFKDNFYNNFAFKGKTFFKKDMFERDLVKELSISKEVVNSKKMTNYVNIYQIEPTIRDHFYNLNFDPPCTACIDKKLDEKFINNNCLVCMELIKQFESIYIVIYDLIVKYFYIPENLNEYEKEIYYGYYLNEFLRLNQNKIEYYMFQRLVPNQKYEMFVEEVMHLSQLELNYFTVNKLKLYKSNEDCLNKEKDLIELYKFFVIFNGLFIMLFKKYQDFTRRIRDKSHSYEKKMQYENEDVLKNKYNSFYSYLFIQLFELEDEEKEVNVRKSNQHDKLLEDEEINSMNNKNTKDNNSEFINVVTKKNQEKQIKKLDIIKYALKQAAIDKLNIEDKAPITPIDSFFKDPEINLFDQYDEDLYKKVNPPEVEYNSSIIYKPDILIKLWDTLKVNEKFDIFFGYNALIKSSKISIDKFLETDLIKEETLEIGISDFFTSVHRSELLNSLKFPSSFYNLLLKDLKLFIEENNILDGNKIIEIKDMTGLLKYFSELKLNYLQYYKFYTTIFKKYLFKPKQLVSQLRNLYSNVFKIFNNVNYHLIQKHETKLAFVNFYKLLLSKNKYMKIYDYFDKNDSLISSSKFDNNFEEESDVVTNDAVKRFELGDYNKNSTDKERKKSMVEIKQNENYIMNQYEIFILVLSMGPIEFIEAIRFIEEDYLRDFYMFMFIYIHADDTDFNLILEYLKNKARCLTVEKYINYCTYMNEREEVLNEEENFLLEQETLNNTINYIKDYKIKLENLIETKNRLINKLNLKLDEKEEDNNN